MLQSTRIVWFIHRDRPSYFSSENFPSTNTIFLINGINATIASLVQCATYERTNSQEYQKCTFHRKIFSLNSFSSSLSSEEEGGEGKKPLKEWNKVYVTEYLPVSAFSPCLIHKSLKIHKSAAAFACVCAFRGLCTVFCVQSQEVGLVTWWHRNINQFRWCTTTQHSLSFCITLAVAKCYVSHRMRWIIAT